MRINNLAFILIIVALFFVAYALQFSLLNLVRGEYVFFLLLHVYFYTASQSLSYPMMLLFALITGLLWDASTMSPIQSELENNTFLYVDSFQSEAALGYSVFLFGLIGSLVHGLSPFFKAGKLFLTLIFSFIALLLHLFLEFAFIIFFKGNATNVTNNINSQFFYQLFSIALANVLLIVPCLFLISYLYTKFFNHPRYQRNRYKVFSY